MANKPAVIIYKESLPRSIISDLSTFGFLILCVYVSKDSAGWTFITGAMFLFFICVKLIAFSGSDSTLRFYSLDEMQAWLDKQEKTDA